MAEFFKVGCRPRVMGAFGCPDMHGLGWPVRGKAACGMMCPPRKLLLLSYWYGCVFSEQQLLALQLLDSCRSDT